MLKIRHILLWSLQSYCRWLYYNWKQPLRVRRLTSSMASPHCILRELPRQCCWLPQLPTYHITTSEKITWISDFGSSWKHAMGSMRHILMGRNGDYFLNYIVYSKNVYAVLTLFLVILGNHRNYCSKHCILGYY